MQTSSLVFFVFYLACFLIPPSYLSSASAQNIGINNSGAAADGSAGLDVNFTNKGVLIPRVALTSTTDASTISSPASYLLVCNTATAGSSPTTVVPGFYYNAGTPGSPNWYLFSAIGSGSTDRHPGFYFRWHLD